MSAQQHSTSKTILPAFCLVFLVLFFLDTGSCFVAQVSLDLFARVIFNLLRAGATGIHHPMETAICAKQVWFHVTYSVPNR